MTDIVIVFLLGPLFFFPRLLSIRSVTSTDFIVFATSGLGAVFWATVVTVVGGVMQEL